MIRITKTFIRPSTSIPWYFQTDEGKAWEAYRISTQGDKLSDSQNVASPDGLTWTHSITWASREDFDARVIDATYNAGLEARKAYNAEHGIFESDTQIVNL